MPKLSELTINPSLSTDDLLYVVNDPAGTPYSYKTTIANLISLFVVQVNTWTGLQTFTATDASTKGLIVKGFTSQTANLQEWQNSSSAVLLKVKANGGLVVNGGGLTLTEDTDEINPVVLSSVNVGLFANSSITGQYGCWAGTVNTYGFTYGGGVGLRLYSNSISYASINTDGQFNINNDGGTSAQLFVNNGSSSRIGLIVKGATSQTANLQEWQNSSSTVLASITKDGYLGIGGTPSSLFHVVGNNGSFYTHRVGDFCIQPYGTNNIIIGSNCYFNGSSYTRIGSGYVEGIHANNGNIVIFTSNTGSGTFTQNIQFKADYTGAVAIGGSISTISGDFTGSLLYIAANGRVGINKDTNPESQLHVVVNNSSLTGLIVKGATSQTANLQQWQNSSSIALVSITKDGYLGIAGTPSSLFHIVGNNTSLYSHRVGDFCVQPYGPNNIIFGDNCYFNGGSYTRVGTGYVEAFQLYNGQTNIFNSDTGSGNFSQSVQLKVNYTGAVAIGGSMTNAIGTYTGALLLVAADGKVAVNKTSSIGAQFHVVSASASNIGQIIQGASSQTANLQEWQNSAGTVLSVVDKDGKLGVGYSSGLAPQVYLDVYGGIASTSYYIKDTSVTPYNPSTNRVGFFGKSGIWFGTSDANPILTSYGNAVYLSADNSSPYTRGLAVWSTGVGVNTYTDTPAGYMEVRSVDAARKGLIVKGASSQSANLTEWQNSAGTVVGTVTKDGFYRVVDPGTGRYGEFSTTSNITYIGGADASLSTNLTAGGVSRLTISTTGAVAVGSFNASVVGFTIQGAASQTANLQEWKNSAGSVLASLSSNCTVLSMPDGFAIGGGSHGANNGYGVLLGYGASGFNAGIAIGYSATAGTYTAHNIAIGYQSNSAYTQDIAIGVNSYVNSGDGIALGTSANVTYPHLNSIAFGAYAQTFETASCTINTGLNTAGNATIINLQGQSSTTARQVSRIVTSWITSTDASRASRFTLSTFYTSTAQEGLRIDSASDQARIAIGGNVVSGARATIYTGVSTDKGLIVQGASSQSANLQEWQDNNAVIVSHIKANGGFETKANCLIGSGTLSVGTNGVGVLVLGNSTAPTTYPADLVQLFAEDLSAGNSALNVAGEGSTALVTLGGLIVRQKGGAPGTDQIDIYHDGTVGWITPRDSSSTVAMNLTYDSTVTSNIVRITNRDATTVSFWSGKMNDVTITYATNLFNVHDAAFLGISTYGYLTLGANGIGSGGLIANHWNVGAPLRVYSTGTNTTPGGFSSPGRTPAQITADQNNYAPGVGLFQRWSSDADRTITGMESGYDGEFRWIWNIGSFTITIANQSTSSTAANRFLTDTGADIYLVAGACAFAEYDTTTTRWRIHRLGGKSKQTIWMPSTGILPNVTGGCAALASTSMGSGKPDIWSLDFDATTAEYAQFTIAMPKGWDLGTVTAEFLWMHPATATNFGVRWGIQGVAISDDDSFDTTFGTAQEVTDTGGTTSDLYTSSETSAITIGGTPAINDLVCFRIYRDPANAGDTMAVDAKLVGVRIKYTVSNLDDR